MSSSQRITGQQRLANALDEFRKPLSTTEQAALSQTSQPDTAAVTEFSSQLNNERNLRRKRLGDKLEPFFILIQDFGSVVSVYIHGYPTIAASVWGCVKFVVRAAANHVEYFVKISDLLKKLEHLFPRLERIKDLFENAIKLQEAVIDFYAIIIEFCTKIFHFLRQRGLKNYSKEIWAPFKSEFRTTEDQLEDQRRLIDDEVLDASKIAMHQAAQGALIYAAQGAMIYQNHGYTHRQFQVDQWTQNKDWQLQQDAAAKGENLEVTASTRRAEELT
ncbi:hypothetical protein ABW20_dc0109881 [Dactylellina cionopaga]|nr:hypothetical protein ABW20_dc0109881 [Dactylellina cionopaga]